MITSTTFQHAGISTIPIQDRAKTPRISSWREYQTRLPTDAELKSWSKNGANYGVVGGWQGLAVLDFDDMSEYAKWRQWTTGRQVAERVARDAFQVRTSRGVHIYVRLPYAERNRHLGKVDVKAAHGYVLGPGSVHPSGAIYTALRETLYIPLVQSLSDVLPEALLMSQPTPNASAPRPVQADTRDAWERADNVTATNTGHWVADVKQKHRIEQWFPNATKTGAHYLLAKCPLHDDDAPSFWIDTGRQICNCFVCNIAKPMDPIDLYARIFGIGAREAMQLLQQMGA